MDCEKLVDPVFLSRAAEIVMAHLEQHVFATLFIAAYVASIKRKMK